MRVEIKEKKDVTIYVTHEFIVDAIKSKLFEEKAIVLPDAYQVEFYNNDDDLVKVACAYLQYSTERNAW